MAAPVMGLSIEIDERWGVQREVGFVLRENRDGAGAAGDFWVCFAPARIVARFGTVGHCLARVAGGVPSGEY
jgi:hypothetical protein